MPRLTEPFGPDYFRVIGNKTVYSRNPKKNSRVAFALAKLFSLEQDLADTEFVPLCCNNCGKSILVPKEEEYVYCPHCGSSM